MTLKEWLKHNGHSPDWLGRRLLPPVTGKSVRQWIAGNHRPRKRGHIKQIEEITSGNVTVADIICPDG